jgi:hypothetical protein
MYMLSRPARIAADHQSAPACWQTAAASDGPPPAITNLDFLRINLIIEPVEKEKSMKSFTDEEALLNTI